MTNLDTWLLKREAVLTFFLCAGFYRVQLAVADVAGSLPVSYDWSYANLDAELIQPGAEIMYRLVEYRGRAKCWHCGADAHLFNHGWQCSECPEGSPSTMIARSPQEGCSLCAPYVLEA